MNVNITMLGWLFNKLVFRAEPGQLVLRHSTLACPENGCVWISINLITVIWKITKHVNTSNSSCYLEMFKTVFIVMDGNILHYFVARVILYKYTILEVKERVNANLEQPEAKVQWIVTDFKNKCFFLIQYQRLINQRHYILYCVCVRWHWVTSWDVGCVKKSTLLCFGFQGCWEQDGSA